MQHEEIKKLLAERKYDSIFEWHEDGVDEENNQYVLLVNKSLNTNGQFHQVTITYNEAKKEYNLMSLHPTGNTVLTANIPESDLQVGFNDILSEILYKEMAVFAKLINDKRLNVTTNLSEDNKIEGVSDQKIII